MSQDLIDRAESQGASFELRGERVWVKAPTRLPDDLMAELRLRKAMVRDLLRQRGQTADAGPPSPTAEIEAPEAGLTTTDEADARSSEFEHLRLQAQSETEQTVVEPQVVDQLSGPKLDAVDESDWHGAFESLAAERGISEDDQAPSADDTHETLDRDAAFDQLREQASDEPPRPAPVVEEAAPVVDQAAGRDMAFDQLRDQVEYEPAEPEPLAEEAATMDVPLEQLRGQAADQPAQPEPVADEAGPVVDDAASRDAAFRQLREQVMALDSADDIVSQSEDQSPAVATEEPLGGPDASAAEETETAPDGVTTAPPDAGPTSLLSRIKSPFTRSAHPTGEADEAPKSLVSTVRHGLNRLSIGGAREVTSITIEHGSIKVLKTRGFEVAEYRNILANPRHFREGLVSDAPRMAALLQGAIQEVNGAKGRVIGAVPGYQTNLRALELPNVRAMDPKQIIPQEARRKLGISTDNSYLTWHQMSSGAEMARWLVISATNRSISSLFATTLAAGLRISVMDLRPFALARALNQPHAICAWTAPDGCDAVVVRDWVPMTHQAAYWGAGAMGESADLVNRGHGGGGEHDSHPRHAEPRDAGRRRDARLRHGVAGRSARRRCGAGGREPAAAAGRAGAAAVAPRRLPTGRLYREHRVGPLGRIDSSVPMRTVPASYSVCLQMRPNTVWLPVAFLMLVLMLPSIGPLGDHHFADHQVQPPPPLAAGLPRPLFRTARPSRRRVGARHGRWRSRCPSLQLRQGTDRDRGADQRRHRDPVCSSVRARLDLPAPSSR